MQDDEILSIRELEQLTGKHHATLRRWWGNGLFPKPKRTGPNSIGVTRGEYLNWLKTRPRIGDPGEAA